MTTDFPIEKASEKSFSTERQNIGKLKDYDIRTMFHSLAPTHSDCYKTRQGCHCVDNGVCHHAHFEITQTGNNWKL
jgi:hypothetical protein